MNRREPVFVKGPTVREEGLACSTGSQACGPRARRIGWAFALLAATLVATAAGSSAALAQTPAPSGSQRVRVACASKPGERQHCPADTSKGVVLGRSTGEAPCLLGKTWGYDDKGIWVSDGCSGEFVVGQRRAGGDGEGGRGEDEAPAVHPQRRLPAHLEGEKGEIYVRLFSYARYLNQKGLDATYTDAFGNTKTVQQREDIQLNKFFLPFSGWFLTPKLRYYLYVWSSNPSQGDPAQVVGAGNLSYVFNRHVTFGGGITSLPERAQHRGPVPVLARRRRPPDRGRVLPRLLHHRDLAQGRALHQAQVHGDARQQPEHARRERGADRQHARHDVAHAAVAAHDGRVRPLRHLRRLRPPREAGDAPRRRTTRTAPRTSRASRARTRIENSQIRLTDGSVIFTPDLFGPGHHRREGRTTRWSSVDGGVKYKGLSLEAEYYWRWLSDFRGTNTAGIEDIDDTASRSSPRRWWCRRSCRST